MKEIEQIELSRVKILDKADKYGQTVDEYGFKDAVTQEFAQDLLSEAFAYYKAVKRLEVYSHKPKWCASIRNGAVCNLAYGHTTDHYCIVRGMSWSGK